MSESDESSSGSLGSTSSSLLRRVRARDEQAWTRLVRLYGPLVDDWLRPSGLDENDRNDIFQEVFRSVAQSIGGFSKNRPGGSFRAWLRTLTEHRLADFFRRRGQDPSPGGTGALRRLENIAQPPAIVPEDDGALDRIRRNWSAANSSPRPGTCFGGSSWGTNRWPRWPRTWASPPPRCGWPSPASSAVSATNSRGSKRSPSAASRRSAATRTPHAPREERATSRGA